MSKDKVEIRYGLEKDALGANIQALFNGMEGLVSAKTVIGEPVNIGDIVLIPLIEVSAGLASGALTNNSKNNGASAMSTKISPAAMLIIQGDRVRLVNVKNQDVFTRLLDLIPEAIDKIKKGAVDSEVREKAQNILDSDDIEIITPEN